MLCPCWDTGHEDIRLISVVDVLNLDLQFKATMDISEGESVVGLTPKMEIEALFCATKIQTKDWE